MKTTLTPPPITPGPWRVVARKLAEDSQLPFGVEAPVLHASAVEPVCDMMAFPPTSEKQMERYRVNAQFIAAAPAMAEVLEALIQAYDHAPPVDLLKHIADCYLKAHKALLAAGYTEAPADAE